MTNRKNYNSIVFLTTLSVYFGLVMVGATPQVLAQTSKTVVRTLPKISKQDSSNELDSSRLERFLDRVKAEVGVRRLDLAKPVHVKVQGGFDKGRILASNLILQVDSDNAAVLLELLKEFLVAVDESNLLHALADEAAGEAINGASLEIFHKADETTFDFSFKTNSPQTAQNAAGRFDTLFSLVKNIRKNQPEAKFYENAAIRFENDQVTIVTRMPRASLEEFLTGRVVR